MEVSAAVTITDNNNNNNTNNKTDTTDTGTSHLLQLPAELRMHIYEHALAPTGYLCMSSSSAKRSHISPRVEPALLRSCRLIAREAGALLVGANELTFVVDAHMTCFPVVSERRLPQRLLERLERVCMILDCTGNFHTTYKDVVFTALEGLVALKTLRLVVAYEDRLPRLVELLTEVLMRVPSSTRIECAVEARSGQLDLLRHTMGANGRGLDVVRLVESGELKAAVAMVPEELRGCRSGVTPDVFFETRIDFASISTDPRAVAM